jgi:hypothetical protein
MTWLTWRQFRIQALAAAAALTALAVVYAMTGPNLAHLYDSSGLASCHTHGDCPALLSNFLTQLKSGGTYPFLYFLGAAILYLLPPVIGAFWGAPLVTRELEAGTLRLAWNQSVTRARWMTVKLGLLGLAAAITAGLLSLEITWWAGPIDRAGGFPVGLSQLSRFSPLVFGARGLAPVGYAVFAFVLGVTIGVLVRRTVPAMALTLIVLAAALLAWPNFVRPSLIAPVQATSAAIISLSDATVHSDGQISVPVTGLPGAWLISDETLTPAGHVFVLPDVSACQSGTQQQCDTWLAGQHLRQWISFQPASRFWEFQWYETAIYLAFALALAGGCILWVRYRRLS